MNIETTKRAEHTAGYRPGEVRAMRCSDGWHVVTNVGRREVARCHAGTGYDDATDEANARRLALCWNTHDELVAALAAYIAWHDSRHGPGGDAACHQAARAALARADGEAATS